MIDSYKILSFYIEISKSAIFHVDFPFLYRNIHTCFILE